jgi:hypothetical protein
MGKTVGKISKNQLKRGKQKVKEMSMDLAPKAPIDSFHTNNAGWYFLWRVLDLAGADTSEMRSSNDGDLVHAETARSWAKAIRRLLAKNSMLELKVAKVADDLYSGGYASIPVVSLRRNLKAKEIAYQLKFGPPPSIAEQVRQNPFQALRGCTEVIGVTKLPKSDEKWLREFARFCERSGGFRQY